MERSYKAADGATFTVSAYFVGQEPERACKDARHSPIGQEDGDPAHACPACGTFTVTMAPSGGAIRETMSTRLVRFEPTGSN